jgi:hypothetical protein
MMIIHQKFTNTWRKPYRRSCATCGKYFFSLTPTAKYCTEGCMPRGRRRENGMVTVLVKATCPRCQVTHIENLKIPNKSIGVAETLLCRSCVMEECDDPDA